MSYDLETPRRDALQVTAGSRGLERHIKVDKPFLLNAHALTGRPEAPTAERIQDRENARRLAEYKAEHEAWEALPQPEQEVTAEPEAPRMVGLAIKWKSSSNNYDALWTWFKEFVEPALLSSTLAERQLLHLEIAPTIWNIVRALKERVSLTEESITNSAYKLYRSVLARARLATEAAYKWNKDWIDSYLRVKAFGIPEVEVYLGIEDYLMASGERMAPYWARARLDEIAQREALGATSGVPFTHDQYCKWFRELLKQR
ncbi:hypothetical protein CHU98_g11777 [Xylaria longipes]|nr:hypothetical protein CHU98_g11777 [Xylaria longipes]